MNNKLIISTFLLCNQLLFSQNTDDTLFGMVNQKIVKVNQNTGLTVDYVTITNFPSTAPSRLTWKESEQCYYTLGHIGSAVKTIGKINSSGLYSNLGQISIPGYTVSVIEGIAINPIDNQLYACVSLNGSDPWSESFIRINTETMIGEKIGEFNHTAITNNSEAEADVIAFDEQGNLYYFDADPPGANRIRIFQQELTFTQPAVLKGSASYVPIFDMTIKGENVYFGTSQNLRSFNLSTNSFSTIGNMTPSSLFSGQDFRGLTWKKSNDLGIEKIKEEVQFIYPNPASNMINIKFDTPQEYDVTIYDIYGKVVHRNPHSIANNKIDTRNWDNGTYIVTTVTNDNLIKTQKLIINH